LASGVSSRRYTCPPRPFPFSLSLCTDVCLPCVPYDLFFFTALLFCSPPAGRCKLCRGGKLLQILKENFPQLEPAIFHVQFEKCTMLESGVVFISVEGRGTYREVSRDHFFPEGSEDPLFPILIPSLFFPWSLPFSTCCGREPVIGGGSQIFALEKAGPELSFFPLFPAGRSRCGRFGDVFVLGCFSLALLFLPAGFCERNMMSQLPDKRLPSCPRLSYILFFPFFFFRGRHGDG